MTIAGMQRNLRRGCLAVAVMSLSLVMNCESADAHWGSRGYGSWGSSGGSSGGSYGSFGSSGGSHGSWGGRRHWTPVRNFFGRIHARKAARRAARYGSSGGSYGSWGSSGGSYGSTYVSTSYGSWGSSGGSYYGGSSGGSYGSVSQPVYAAPAYGSSVVPGSIMGSTTTAPVESPYYNPGYSLGSEVPVDGGVIDQSGAGSMQNVSPGQTISPTPSSVIDGNTSPVPAPGPDNDSTRIRRPSASTAVLTLNVPEEAKVYINDRLTKTKGTSRSYVSRNLKSDRSYQYLVKAVVERDGQDLVSTQMVTIKTGQTKTIAMNFKKSNVTSLAISVPKDAKVVLCGKKTNVGGATRYFETTKLKDGTTWKDYTVEVSIERNGKVLTREKTIDMLAGKSYSLSFDFADSAKEKVASK